MCFYVQDTNVAPGWGCCRCRTYNGLQRQWCRACSEPRHEEEIKIPDDIERCAGCGCGLPEGMLGVRPRGGEGPAVCPSCGAAWGAVTS